MARSPRKVEKDDAVAVVDRPDGFAAAFVGDDEFG